MIDRLKSSPTVANEPDHRVIGGRYQVQAPLEGAQDTGAFEAFKAFDLSAGTAVVVRTAPASTFSASARMRLEHEAHVLSQVGDGVFSPLLDFGTEDDQVYLVMPFIRGIALQARLKRGAAVGAGYDHVGPRSVDRAQRSTCPRCASP